MIYSKDDVKRMLDDLYSRFVARLSEGEDCLYAKLLRDAKREVEKKL